MAALIAVLALLAAACGDGAEPAGAPDEADGPEPTEPTMEEEEEDEDGDADPVAEEEPTAEDSFPEQTVRIVVPSDAGGGFDQIARQIQPFWEETLGGTIVVDNRPGGQTSIGTEIVVQSQPDCHTVLMQGVPILPFLFLTQEVGYTYDDLVAVGNISLEPSVLRVRNDAPWADLSELVEDARSRPGEIRASVGTFATNHYTGLLAIQEAVDIDINVVPFQGGGAARTALVAGEVDLSGSSAFSLAIADETRVIAVYMNENQWPEITDDAATVNEQLGTDLPENSALWGVYAPAGCKDEHPGRYELLESSLDEAVNSDGFLEMLTELGEEAKVAYLDGGTLDQMTRDSIEEMRDFVERYNIGSD